MAESVLVINSGSSSIKYQLVEPSTGQAIAKGIVERIGLPMGHLEHTYNGTKTVEDIPFPDHGAGLREVIRIFNEHGPQLDEQGLVGVGHRIVQGAHSFDGPTLITPEVRDRILQLADMAPLHNRAHVKGIDVAQQVFPELPHVAVFDTAFFQSLPDKNRYFALNAEVAQRYEIARYGAHGTSHQFISQRISQLLGRDDLKQIVLHLGNGASASAIVNGKAVDTSMGLTPLEGLVMGTRTGDIDPAVVFHLERVGGMSVDEVDTLFNKQSGMFGMTGLSDMRDIWALANSDDAEGSARAKRALDMYINRIVKYIGSYVAEMGGVDVITFTAGIGENDPRIREGVIAALKPFGVTLDNEANTIDGGHLGEPTTISAADSSVRVVVYPTNEEWAIAQHVADLVATLS